VAAEGEVTRPHPLRTIRQYVCHRWLTHEVDWRTEAMMGVRVCKHCATSMPLERAHTRTGD
jgi:hypothetical protein